MPRRQSNRGKPRNDKSSQRLFSKSILPDQGNANHVSVDYQTFSVNQTRGNDSTFLGVPNKTDDVPGDGDWGLCRIGANYFNELLAPSDRKLSTSGILGRGSTVQIIRKTMQYRPAGCVTNITKDDSGHPTQVTWEHTYNIRWNTKLLSMQNQKNIIDASAARDLALRNYVMDTINPAKDPSDAIKIMVESYDFVMQVMAGIINQICYLRNNLKAICTKYPTWENWFNKVVELLSLGNVTKAERAAKTVIESNFWNSRRFDKELAPFIIPSSQTANPDTAVIIITPVIYAYCGYIKTDPNANKSIFSIPFQWLENGYYDFKEFDLAAWISVKDLDALRKKVNDYANKLNDFVTTFISFYGDVLAYINYLNSPYTAQMSGQIAWINCYKFPFSADDKRYIPYTHFRMISDLIHFDLDQGSPDKQISGLRIDDDGNPLATIAVTRDEGIPSRAIFEGYYRYIPMMSIDCDQPRYTALLPGLYKMEEGYSTWRLDFTQVDIPLRGGSITDLAFDYFMDVMYYLIVGRIDVQSVSRAKNFARFLNLQTDGPTVIIKSPRFAMTATTYWHQAPADVRNEFFKEELTPVRV